MAGGGACQVIGRAWRWAAECAEQGWFAETALNIGFACQLLSENMLILEEKDVK